MRMGFLAVGALLPVVLTGCTADESSPDAAAPPSVTDVATDLPPCPEQGAGSAVGSSVPGLALDCLGGGSLDLGLAAGTPTVLNLWASWCGPCRTELPFVEQLADVAGDRLRVIGVSSQDGVPQATSFAADAGLTFPSAFDADGELAAGLGLTGLPHSVFLAADGSLAHVEVGAVESFDELRALVGEHLGVQL
jgi:cytochrome c biogenesis protein CcmG, thiol:disulfide interchange protein DsbE